MSHARITIEGFTAEPRERTTQSGRQVVTVAVGHTPRRKNREGQWEDAGETTWFEADFWDGEAVGIRKGTRVMLTGEPAVNVFVGKDGTARGTVKIQHPMIAIVQQPARSGQETGRGASNGPSGSTWASSDVSGAQAGAQPSGWASPVNSDNTPF